MNIDEFLVDDYKLKLDYLKSQFDRMWTRFNFFLSIEVALFGFLGWLVFEKHNLGAMLLPASIGLAVSGLWYIIGAQDRALVEFYRSNVNDAAKRIANNCKDELEWYGNGHAAIEAKSVFNGLTSWYWKTASITRMPAVVSLMLIVIWLMLLLYGRHLFERL
jgi:hypothetical protein